MVNVAYRGLPHYEWDNFIAAIRSRPALWNVDSNKQATPKVKQLNQQQWQEVSELFGITVEEAKLQWNNVCCIHRRLHHSLDDKHFVTIDNVNATLDERWTLCYDYLAHSISHFVHDELNFLLK
ncbi:unnamed protein product [Anisakis simplex]|uniref:MADF domain-containing protein n=1 Tax=Anisakis simplex TaxID=6269 RepID=A0A0M3J3P9_ANISI|nr:unnamed protein product [Anisakis simplex]